MSLIERSQPVGVKPKMWERKSRSCKGVKAKRRKTNWRNALTREHRPVSSELTNIFCKNALCGFELHAYSVTFSTEPRLKELVHVRSTVDLNVIVQCVVRACRTKLTWMYAQWAQGLTIVQRALCFTDSISDL